MFLFGTFLLRVFLVVMQFLVVIQCCAAINFFHAIMLPEIFPFDPFPHILPDFTSAFSGFFVVLYRFTKDEAFFGEPRPTEFDAGARTKTTRVRPGQPLEYVPVRHAFGIGLCMRVYGMRWNLRTLPASRHRVEFEHDPAWSEMAL